LASPSRRLALVDAVKATAAQLIVLHHLAWYGPLADGAGTLAPWLGATFAWLAEYGRYAVYAFLAVGGFLAAQGLPPQGLPAGAAPRRLIGRRYARLVGPYAFALALAVLCAALARQWMTHTAIGAPAQLSQFIAHLLLLHDLLGFEALSAGVWYVAIDFQLYALLVLLLWLGSRRPAGADFAAGALLVLLAALASLFWFGRDARWDATALYFFGAYAFGIGSGWTVRQAHPARLLMLVGGVGLLALAWDFRGRLAVALLTALAVGIAQRAPRLASLRPVAAFGKASYALFLVHFPVCLLVSALFMRFMPHTPAWQLLGLCLAWLASNLTAFVFHRWIETPLAPRLASVFAPARSAGMR